MPNFYLFSLSKKIDQSGKISRMKLKLREKIPQTSDVISFVFEPQERLDWQAGQYLHYNLPHENPDDRGTERYFTIAASPLEKVAIITTRIASKRSSTFKENLIKMQVDDTIEADTPEGDFILGDVNKEYVFLAGGIGITPFRAILKNLDLKGQKPKITLLYSNRNEEIVYKEEFDKFQENNPNLNIIYMVSPQKIDEAFIKEKITDIQKPIFYMSGPEPMIDALGETLKQMRVDEEHLKQDWFPGYPPD
jgi:ferredoxin-NADP reductase